MAASHARSSRRRLPTETLPNFRYTLSLPLAVALPGQPKSVLANGIDTGYNCPFVLPHSAFPTPLPFVLLLPVNSTELAAAFGLTVIGSAIQGNVGIGLAVVAAPILLLMNPVFVPGPIVLAAMLLVILIAIRDRRDVIVEDIGLAVFGRAIGTLPAVYVMGTLPGSVYQLLFGAMVILGVLLSALGWHIRPTPKHIVVASIASGFMSTVASIGGPPLALLYQNEAGPRIRATISAIFTIGGMISLLGLWWVDRFGRVELMLGVFLMPAVVVGFIISRYTTPWIDRERIKPAILAISAFAAVVVLARAMTIYL